MGIFLIIVGAICLILSGIIFIPSASIIKNQKNWDDFYKMAQEQENMISTYPEEALYKLICKMNLVSCIIFCISLMVLLGGILLVTIG